MNPPISVLRWRIIEVIHRPFQACFPVLRGNTAAPSTSRSGLVKNCRSVSVHLFQRSYSRAQYVTSVADALATTTLGRRYIFAPIDPTTVSLETRLNLTISPTLTFELYMQPLVSSRQYAGLKELGAPRTFDFLRYGDDVGLIVRQSDKTYLVDPDGAGATTSFSVRDRGFKVRSLLGNAVLRWGWSPGSTPFLVRQRSRSQRLAASDADAVGAGVVEDFHLAHDSAELFRIPPNNIFLVKVNYWLNF